MWRDQHDRRPDGGRREARWRVSPLRGTSTVLKGYSSTVHSGVRSAPLAGARALLKLMECGALEGTRRWQRGAHDACHGHGKESKLGARSALAVCLSWLCDYSMRDEVTQSRRAGASVPPPHSTFSPAFSRPPPAVRCICVARCIASQYSRCIASRHVCRRTGPGVAVLYAYRVGAVRRPKGRRVC